MKILEIGPDRFPSTYKICIKNEKIKWDTLELAPRGNVTYVANNEYSFPIEDNYYDIVFSGQVIEHVRKLWIWIKELSRICKIGGHVITINPISWPYHKEPIDCWRIYPEGMKALYEEAGLKILLSVFRSLEALKVRKNGFKRIIPGKTAPPEALMSFSKYVKHLIKNIKHPKKFGHSLITYGKMLIGCPVSCSFDAITIGIKE